MVYLNALMIVISVFITQKTDIKGVTVQFVEQAKPSYVLYVPENKDNIRKAMMLVNGLILDTDDKLIDNYSKLLAKYGVAVMTPKIGSLNRLMFGEKEKEAVRGSFTEMTRLFPSKPKGVFSFCFSNMTVCLAMKEIAGKIDFMYLFGSIASMKDMLEYNICGYYQIPDKKEVFYIESNRDIVEVYYRNFANLVPNQKRFMSALQKNDSSGLSTEERKAYALLKNQKYLMFEELYRELPEMFKKPIVESSPINNIDSFNCKMTFIHLKRDALAPYYESVKLYNKCPSKNKKLILIDLPLHTSESQNMSGTDMLSRLKYLYEFYMLTVDLLS